jgi:chemotaxis protein MotB
MSDTSNVIVVKRRRKKGNEAHGGAWKIAYADFVTAMMAFFLLMWLLSATSQEQKEGIAEFFTVFNLSSSAGSDGLLEGKVIDEPSSATAQNRSSPVAIAILPPAPGQTAGPEETARKQREEEALERAIEEQEKREFTETEDHLRDALLTHPEMANHLLLERTPEGLRIHIVDQERTPMFALGSSQLAPQANELLRLVAGVIANVPNRISVSGHTDGLPLSRANYSNWELSADRANAARRVLVMSRIPEERILRVLGLADRQPLVPETPNAPSNRRISILLMSAKAAQSAIRQ